MIKMMVIVVVFYSVCWLPYNVLMIMIEDINEEVLMYIYFPIHGLAMSHACYNPIIYCFMNSRFREGLVNILRSIPCARRFIKPVRCSNFGRTGVEGSESTSLHRNNTCTTYISMKRKNFSNAGSYQLPVRSMSLRNSSQNNMKRPRYSNVVDEQL